MASAAITCAERVSLLALLHSKPHLPLSNPIEQDLVKKRGYVLPFERELQLAGGLAFLSSVKDDPNCVTAVCVGEDKDSLKVLLAMNKTTATKNDKALETVQLGFQQIFAILSRVTENSNPAVHAEVFASIVTMCYSRILSRLGLLKNYRKTWEKPFHLFLDDFLLALKSLQTGTKAIPEADEINSFLQEGREAVKLIDSWRKFQTPQQLGVLVECLLRLRNAGDLPALLSTISNRLMTRQSKKGLLKIVTKVARYREAARFLYRTAKRYPIVRHMSTILATLPPDAFATVRDENWQLSLQSTLAQIHGSGKDSAWNVQNISRYLNMEPAASDSTFAEQVAKTLREAKVHAEIQLIYHCEVSEYNPLPRVVCSSKDCCFLCNTFILSYGRMHTPRSHGKLYPGWKLPTSLFLSKQRKFNKELFEISRRSLTHITSTKRKVVYPDPNESTLIPLTESASTIDAERSGHNTSSNERTKKPARNNKSSRQIEQTGRETASEQDTKQPHERTASIETVEGNGTAEETETDVAGSESYRAAASNGLDAQNKPMAKDSTEDVKGLVDPGNESAQSRARIVSSIDEVSAISEIGCRYDLVQGQRISKRIKPNRETALYRAGQLGIQAEYSTGPNHGGTDRPGGLKCNIEWLTQEEMVTIRQRFPASVIQAASLDTDNSFTIPKGERHIYIADGECMLRLSLE